MGGSINKQRMSYIMSDAMSDTNTQHVLSKEIKMSFARWVLSGLVAK